MYYILVIYLGADHRGFELKAKIAKRLAGRANLPAGRDYEFEDLGAYEYDHDDDYVDFALAVAEAVAKNPTHHHGVVICGSGVGVDIVANKVAGIRCGLGFAPDQVHAARKDDDINVLALAADNTNEAEGWKLVEVFLDTGFATSDRYLRRLEKITRVLERG